MVTHTKPISQVYIDGVRPEKSDIRTFETEQDTAINAAQADADLALEQLSAVDMETVLAAADRAEAAAAALEGAIARTVDVVVFEEIDLLAPPATFSGVARFAGMSVAIGTQALKKDNGVYVFNAGSGHMERREDFDESGDFSSGLKLGVGDGLFKGCAITFGVFAEDFELGTDDIEFTVDDYVTGPTVWRSNGVIKGGLTHSFGADPNSHTDGDSYVKMAADALGRTKSGSGQSGATVADRQAYLYTQTVEEGDHYHIHLGDNDVAFTGDSNQVLKRETVFEALLNIAIYASIPDADPRKQFATDALVSSGSDWDPVGSNYPGALMSTTEGDTLQWNLTNTRYLFFGNVQENSLTGTGQLIVNAINKPDLAFTSAIRTQPKANVLSNYGLTAQHGIRCIDLGEVMSEVVVQLVVTSATDPLNRLMPEWVIGLDGEALSSVLITIANQSLRGQNGYDVGGNNARENSYIQGNLNQEVALTLAGYGGLVKLLEAARITNTTTDLSQDGSPPDQFHYSQDGAEKVGVTDPRSLANITRAAQLPFGLKHREMIVQARAAMRNCYSKVQGSVPVIENFQRVLRPLKGTDVDFSDTLSQPIATTGGITTSSTLTGAHLSVSGDSSSTNIVRRTGGNGLGIGVAINVALDAKTANDGPLLGFTAHNSADADKFYGAVGAVIDDATAASEDGHLGFYTIVAGTFTKLMKMASTAFMPIADNVMDLGGGSNRMKVLYAGTGTISTSDRALKVNERELSAAEKRVAVALRKLPRVYQFRDAFEEKGDSARLHAGFIFQDVVAAFKAEKLDPERYGIVCRDPATKLVKTKKKVRKPRMVTKFRDVPEVTMVDGRAVVAMVAKEYEAQATKAHPVFDEAGVALFDNEGLRVVYEEPLFDEVDDEVFERVPDLDAKGVQKMMLALRYDELHSFIIAGME